MNTMGKLLLHERTSSMERKNSISKVILFLMIHETMITITASTTNRTYTNNEYMSATPPDVYQTHMDPWQSDTAVQRSPPPSQGRSSPVLAKTNQFKNFTLSLLPKTTTNFSKVSIETPTDRAGVITFPDPVKHAIKTWNIHLPSEDGIMLRVNYISLFYYCSVKIVSFRSLPGDVREHKFSFTLWKNAHTLSLNTSLLQVVLSDKWGCDSSVLNISYSAYPAHKMPWVFHPFSDLYICSRNVIHSVLRCNMVQECAGNEDEADCDYTHQGCGSWVPFRDLCLKLEFMFHPYRHSINTASEAEKTCFTRYGARLVQLEGSDDVDSLGRIIRQAGFTTAVIGRKRVKPVSRRLKHLYRFLWQWGDRGGPLAYQQKHQLLNGSLDDDCTYINVTSGSKAVLEHVKCHQPDQVADGCVCMKPNPLYRNVTVDSSLSVHLLKPSRQISQFPTRKCSDGSFVQTFHSCSTKSGHNTIVRSTYRLALFPCRYGQPVHYTFVCDGNADCIDRSDETDCEGVVFPLLLNSMFRCENSQLVPKTQRCDGKYDCFDESDEIECLYCHDDRHAFCGTHGCLSRYYTSHEEVCYAGTPSGLSDKENNTTSLAVSMDGFGSAFLLPAEIHNKESLIECRDKNYHIPSFLLNNGELDCTTGEDENIPTENMTCPGFYRCYISKSCVHPDQVCDGIHHCPYKDDERYCGILCPDECLCEGNAFFCSRFSNIPLFLQVRYLDFSGSVNISLNGIHFLELLQVLNLSYCGLDVVYLRAMPQLRGLDLSFNELKNVSSFVFEGLSGVHSLNISGNPFVPVLDNFLGTIRQLNNLKHFVMRRTELRSIGDRAFSALTQLETLDIRDNFIDNFDRELFWGLGSLRQLYTDDSSLCCPYFHDSRVIDCVAPFDELSSCEDLLRQNFFRTVLWLVTLSAILGNASVMLYHLLSAKLETLSTFCVLVINLCAADLLMGMYMMLIGINDAQFQGEYVAHEKSWKRSIMCKLAGFLGFVSSEASAMTVCLITLDRALVLCFPLKSHFHLTARSSLAACGVLWFVAATLATLPLMVGLEFYGVSSICLPLPITRRQFSGQFYCFGIFIIFNFILFIIIGLGQILIYRAILSAGKAAGTSRRPQEMTIARRLFLVILSDFCCWFPVGVMGLLVANGNPIPDEVNVWTVIFVLPLNSALNPFLYTLNSVLENWRAKTLKKKTENIVGRIQTTLPIMPSSMAEQLVRICIQSNVVKREKILQMLQWRQESTVDGSDT